MAYGSGFGNNLPPWKPMATMTPPPPATLAAAPGPISNYNAGQLRMLQHTQAGGPMPPSAAARPPSTQAPLNSSIGQPTPRSAGIGGATSPRLDSLSKFDNFLRPNTAFTPQATVNTPGLVEGMANTPRSMGPLFSGSVPQSAYQTYLANGGVLPPEAPKPTVNMAMSGNPKSTVGYSMGGGQPPRSPGAPFSVPPSGGGGDMGGSMEEARNLSRTAGVIGSLARGTPGLALAAVSGPAMYREAMDPRSEFGATWRNAGEAIGRETTMGGKVGATLAAAPFVIGTGVKAGLRPFYHFLEDAVGGGSKAYASPTPTAPAQTPPGSPPPAQPPAATPPTNAGGPRTVTVAPQGGTLSERFPDRFKGLSFANAVSGGANSGRIPLTTQEQNYNAEVLRGMQLENRSRELANVDRYRATQLGDRKALATLAASDGRGLGQGLAREQLDPEGKNDALRQSVDMLDERRNAVTNALFDQNEPSIPNRVANATNKYTSLEDLRNLLKMDPQTFADYVKQTYGRTYDAKSGYFKADR